MQMRQPLGLWRRNRGNVERNEVKEGRELWAGSFLPTVLSGVCLLTVVCCRLCEVKPAVS